MIRPAGIPGSFPRVTEVISGKTESDQDSLCVIGDEMGDHAHIIEDLHEALRILHRLAAEWDEFKPLVERFRNGGLIRRARG